MKKLEIEPQNLTSYTIDIEESISGKNIAPNHLLGNTPNICIIQGANNSRNYGFSGSDVSDIRIPLAAIKNHSALEAIVYYLHVKHFLKYSQIARLLNRDQRTIWNCFNNVKNKIILDVGEDNISLPIDIFCIRSLSILESIVFNLKSVQGLNFNEISGKLGKNYRTIWTVYHRALIKIDRFDEHN